MNKIGIFSGTFDPVHHGHLAFAQRALHELGLDKVYFLVEPQPSHKQAASSLRHRLNMTWLALQDYPKLELLTSDHQQFNVADTLPWLEQKFAQAELHLLMGADSFKFVHTWPGFDSLQRRVKLAVGQRGQDSQQISSVDHLPISTQLNEISSSAIRALKGSNLSGLVPETVEQYIASQGLYQGQDQVR